MADVPPSVLTLTVLGGPLAGQRFTTDESVDEILVGSDPDSRFFLDLPGVSPIHARLWLDLGGLTVYDTRSPRGVYVNDVRVQGQAAVMDGDVLWLGPPGDDASVMIQCRVAGTAAAVPTSPEMGEAVPEAGEPAPEATEFFFEDVAPAAAEAEVTDGSPDLEALIDEPPASQADVPVQADIPEDLVEEPAGAPTDALIAGDTFLFDEEPILEVPAAGSQLVVESDPSLLVEEPAPPVPEVPEESFFVDEPLPVPSSAPQGSPPAPPIPPPVAMSPPPPPVPVPSASAGPEPAMPVPPPPRPAVSPAPSPRRPPAAEAPAARPAPQPAPSRPSRPLGRLLAFAVLALIAVGAAAYFVMGLLATPKIAEIAPSRAGVGHTVTLTGANFAAEPGANEVRMGPKQGRVTQAAPTRIQVEVPDMPTTPGRDTTVPVTVAVGGRESRPVSLAVYQSPRVHGISPNVAMPGDEVRLAGTGWGPGAKVRFGTRDAQVLEATPTALRVRVPPDPGALGQELPVTVSMGADPSNAVSFVVGRLPLITGVEPRSAAPGDQVRVMGRGFNPKPALNQVQIGGKRALVITATGAEMAVVVPRTDPGEAAVEARLPGVENVGQSTLSVGAMPDPIDFRFVAEPFDDEAGHDHAVLATGLGPAFVLTGSANAPAATRALDVQRRLNAAAGPLRAALDADLRVRGIATSPVLTLAGKDEPLLEVTAEDAAGYDEDWTGLRGRGGAVTRARLATWWEAVARDLILLLVRGEKPRHAAALAPEGRILADLHALARKTVGVGVPREAMTSAKPPLREALRVLAFRVPAAVAEPESTAASGAPPPGSALKLEGSSWTGSVTEDGVFKYVALSFADGGGTITYRRALSVSIPIEEVQQPRRNVVTFRVPMGAGQRYYKGTWDGQKIDGRITTDPSGGTEVGTFELVPAK